MISPLRQALLSYDGKTVSTLRQAAMPFAGDKGYMDNLIALCGDEDPLVQEAASWLIKASLEDGLTLSAAQTKSLLGAGGAAQTWQTQLHFCQSVPYLTIPAAAADKTAHTLAPFLTHKRPFLRAWSLTALAHLAEQHEAHEEAAQAALETAFDDKAASVRARARQLTSAIF